jgi:hypothetical protein
VCFSKDVKVPIKVRRTLSLVDTSSSKKMDYSIFVFHSNSGNCCGYGEFHFCVSYSDAPVCRWLALTSWHSQHVAQPMAWSPPNWILVSTVLFCVLKDQIIYLNGNIKVYFTSLSCGYKSAYNTSTPSCPNDSAYDASTVSFNSTGPIDLS